MLMNFTTVFYNPLKYLLLLIHFHNNFFNKGKLFYLIDIIFLVRLWDIRSFAHNNERQLKVLYGAQHNFEKVISMVFINVWLL
jgi:hypothetical protein